MSHARAEKIVTGAGADPRAAMQQKKTKQYGDHLYTKGDYSSAIDNYGR